MLLLISNIVINMTSAKFNTVDKVEVLTLQAVSYTHLRAHETPEHLVCRLLLEKKKKKKKKKKKNTHKNETKTNAQQSKNNQKKDTTTIYIS